MTVNNCRRGQRKLDHIRLFRRSLATYNSMDDIQLIHEALPELDWDDIDLKSRWLGKTLAAPFIINALTGGPPETLPINEALARVTRETEIALAVGSQKGALENKSWEESFRVTRKQNPEGLILANVGGGNNYQAAKQAVEMVHADGLQVHLNAAQELVMPEGDRYFRGWLENVGEIVEKLDVPVIAKEVGCGISGTSARKLHTRGVRIIDVGGRGGTDFTAIENNRGEENSTSLKNWGISTAVSILEVKSLDLSIEIVATGGIRSPLDAAKALALGAKIVGIAGYFLEILLDKGEEALIHEINRWKDDLKRICLLTGCKSPAELQTKPIMITGKTKAWLEALKIN